LIGHFPAVGQTSNDAQVAWQARGTFRAVPHKPEILLTVSQNRRAERCNYVEAQDEAVVEMDLSDAQIGLEAIFKTQYVRIVRIIARVIRDPSHAEELAVEVFLKWSRNPLAKGPKSEGWLYRTAFRMALDELRRGPSSPFRRRAGFDPTTHARGTPCSNARAE
jgi:Sigma-70 region 2